LYLNLEKRFAEAAEALKKAMQISPKSVSVRREFWKTIIEGKTGEMPAPKKAELTKGINSFLKISPDSPKVLSLVHQTYIRAGMSKEKDATEKLILKKFPFSSEAESFLVSQIYRFLYDEKGYKIDKKNRVQAVKMLLDFINRPKHFKVENLEGIYTELFSATKDDKSFTRQDYLNFSGKAANAKPSIGADFYPNLVEGLIERNLLDEAEKYARLGIAATEESLKTRYEYLKDEAVRQNSEKEFRNKMLGSFGKVLFKQKKYDEAESLLIKTESFQYLGEMYVAQNNFEKAEDAYISYLATVYRQDEAWKIIKEFYRKRTGSLNGYEQFEEKVKRLESAKRREKIIAQRIKQPKDTIPFNLKDINGKLINFEELKGKIIMVNAWGTWCEPCVIEMPELQKLYKKYANDKDVAILTIAEDDLKNVQKFMTEKKYDFPVMMGENYFAQVGINVFPTTWFIDKTGKISYIKISSSPKLLEEFSWRIESLR
jgi:thiol-disulfide isomerase/thioredoxin